MIDIQNITDHGLEDSTLDLFRQIARKYCPEELQKERQALLPDEQINLDVLRHFLQPDFESASQDSGFASPTSADKGNSSHTVPHDNGFGIGIK